MADTQILYKNKASQILFLRAYNEITGADVTGLTNILAQLSLDAAASIDLDDNGANATELDATDHPGLYYYVLSAAETNCDLGAVTATSVTANVKITPVIFSTKADLLGGGEDISLKSITVTQTTTDGDAVTLVGDGTGAGLKTTGGATGSGIEVSGGATSGDGIKVTATGGSHAMNLVVSTGAGACLELDNNGSGRGLDVATASGWGISVIGGGHGMYIRGTNSGKGVVITSDASHGLYCVASSSGIQAESYGSGAGISASGAGGSAGIAGNGDGAGAGISATGGATGHGMDINGGATSGDGINIDTTDGHGVSITTAGAGNIGISSVGSTTGAGMQLVGGADGDGLAVVGGSTSGSGMRAYAQANDNAVEFTGAGTGDGFAVTGGATGDAIVLANNSNGADELIVMINATVDTAITDASLATAAALATVDGNVDTLITNVPDIISLTNINAEVDTALADIHLDHLLASADPGSIVANDSLRAKMSSNTGTYSEFDETTDSLEALAENQLANTLGTGAITFTYRVENSQTGDPVADVDVWVTTDAAGDNVIANDKTDQNGNVTFYLDAGTVYVWRQKSGWNFTNPDTEGVS